MTTRVWIAYEPLVFRDALVKVLGQLETVEVVENASDAVDVGVFRLAETGMLQDFFRHMPLPQAKLIVFSAHGERAFIRQPGAAAWKEVEPFGMPQLVAEVLLTPARRHGAQA